jgi:hypothetical protein
MKSRKLGIALLVMLAFVVTSGTFAYWAAGVTGPSASDTTGTITIGSGNTATTTFSFTSTTDSDSLLVPSGFENGTTTFATLPLSYELQWITDGVGGTVDLTGTTTTGTLSVSIAVVVIDDDGLTDVTASVGSLISVTEVDTPASITLGAAAATYSFNVTMSEPADQAEYDLLAGSEIQVTFTWSVGSISTVDNG